MEYKILERKEDIKESVIEKTGHVIHFTMYEHEAVEKKNQKERMAIEGQRNVDKATMDNIEHHHPFVLDLTPEQLFTCHMYQEAKGMVEMCDKKLTEFDKHDAEMAEEMKEIYKQLPELKEVSKVQDLTDGGDSTTESA